MRCVALCSATTTYIEMDVESSIWKWQYVNVTFTNYRPFISTYATRNIVLVKPDKYSSYILNANWNSWHNLCVSRWPGFRQAPINSYRRMVTAFAGVSLRCYVVSTHAHTVPPYRSIKERTELNITSPCRESVKVKAIRTFSLASVMWFSFKLCFSSCWDIDECFICCLSFSRGILLGMLRKLLSFWNV